MGVTVFSISNTFVPQILSLNRQEWTMDDKNTAYSTNTNYSDIDRESNHISCEWWMILVVNSNWM
jgi:hypothetical protein